MTTKLHNRLAAFGLPDIVAEGQFVPDPEGFGDAPYGIFPVREPCQIAVNVHEDRWLAQVLHSLAKGTRGRARVIAETPNAKPVRRLVSKHLSPWPIEIHDGDPLRDASHL